MCQSLLDPQASPSNLRHLKPARLYHQLVVLTGAGRACLSVPKRWSVGSPSTAAALHQRASPQLRRAQTSINQHRGPPCNFPSSSSWRVQDPQHLQEQPKCSPVSPHSLPRGQHPALRGERIFTLSVFSFPNGVAGARCPATYRF